MTGQPSPGSKIISLLKARDDLAKCGLARGGTGFAVVADAGRPIEFASRRRVHDRMKRDGLKAVAVRALSDRAHEHRAPDGKRSIPMRKAGNESK
jgi:hypothetical protein